MMYRFIARPAFLFVVLPLLVACGGDDKSSSTTPPPVLAQTVAGLEAQMREQLDSANTDADFTLMVRANNGRTFVHSVGSSSPTTDYRSASTSKLVTATVILGLVNAGLLSLDDRPQDFIVTWPAIGNLSQIELGHLLSFTSGLSEDPPCLNNPLRTFASCVDDIAVANSSAAVSGTAFHYGSAHLQVAGLMAIRAAGLTSWDEVFNNFKADTSLFDTAVYDLPSALNPRLAGGMHWTAEEYVAFLQALYQGTILTPALITDMTTDKLGGVTIVETPVTAIGEDWHYGFGSWVECHAANFNCSDTTKISSPGAYGAYPFIDFEHDYFGILAREGNLGTFTEGYELFAGIEPQLQEWAALNP